MNVVTVTNDGSGFDRRPDQADGPRPLLPPGTTIGGKYIIQRVLGSGGNGTVYEAEHTAIGHRVAIKVVHASLSGTSEVLARFGREARICGSLRHPNIGQVYDVGVLESGAPYMVMELQEGLSLADILNEMPLSIGAIIELGRQLLAGLSAAHDAGVVHRDVKPGNVMVVRDANDEVVVKLVDFGICKRLDPTDRSVTQRGMMVGSPDYMAPEQLRGEAVDPRTDVYAVGALLYEAITGRTPFDGQTTADLLVAILRAPIEPPRRYRLDCPPELQLLVLAALSRDRASRPPSAEQMARGLALVPLSDERCEFGSTLGVLRERLRANAPASVVVRRLGTVRTFQRLGAQLRAARRRFQPTLLRAAIVTTLGLIMLPVLIAAGDATRQRIAGPSRSSTDDVVVSSIDTPIAKQPGSTPVIVSTSSHSNASAPDDAIPTQVDAARVSRTQSKPTAEDARAVQALLKAAGTAFVHGQAAQARELYLKVLAREPQRPEAIRGLGLALGRLSRNAEAARAFERYLEQQPNAPDAARVRELLDKLRTSRDPIGFRKNAPEESRYSLSEQEQS